MSNATSADERREQAAPVNASVPVGNVVCRTMMIVGPPLMMATVTRRLRCGRGRAAALIRVWGRSGGRCPARSIPAWFPASTWSSTTLGVSSWKLWLFGERELLQQVPGAAVHAAPGELLGEAEPGTGRSAPGTRRSDRAADEDLLRFARLRREREGRRRVAAVGPFELGLAAHREVRAGRAGHLRGCP